MLKRNILFFGICAVFTFMMFTSCKNADGDIKSGGDDSGVETESGTAVDTGDINEDAGGDDGKNQNGDGSEDYVRFKFKPVEGGYEISSYYGTASELEIPGEYEGQPVVSIGDSAFAGCGALISIEIPDCVVFIGYSAFSGCRNLESIKIPDGVMIDGDRLFNG